MTQGTVYYATGRRKTAIARTWLTPGTGQVQVNGRNLAEYFPVENERALVNQPFLLTNTVGTFDVKINVFGGGLSGQAGAVRHGITRALILADPDFRSPLKRAGFVKRDPRQKERKKYGQRAARARFQFSKR